MPKLIHSPQPHSGERRNPDEFSAHSYIQSWHKHSRSLAEDHATLQRMGLVFDFFSAFSRAEYALKATGYKLSRRSEKGKKSDGVEVDWDDFAKDVADKICNSDEPSLVSARKYILMNPPRKQILKKDKLDWKNQRYSDASSTKNKSKNLILYLRRIRNNLFHGGKSSMGPVIAESAERNEKLLKHGLIVLLACIDSIDEVRNAYCDSCDAFVPYPLPNPPPQAGEGTFEVTP